jgi:uncharacterized protein (DUF302 family)
LKRLILILVLLVASSANAGSIYRAQRDGDLVEAMNELQNIIVARGYKVIRVLPVDMGLINAGYAQAPYRIVFFGKDDLPGKLREVPELLAYLPLSITVHEIDGRTLFVAISPLALANSEADPELMSLLGTWDSDIREIFSQLK